MLGQLRRNAERLGRRAASDAFGLVARVRNRNPAPKQLDDVTLARKVETTLFRPADAPKGKVNIDVVDGIVTLRGEVKNPSQKAGLERAAKAIPEVRGVENLLKLPKTPARTRADAPGKSKRTGGRKPSAAKPRSTTAGGRFNREQHSAPAEPSPAELAARGKGRDAAPMGAKDPGTGGAS